MNKFNDFIAGGVKRGFNALKCIGIIGFIFLFGTGMYKFGKSFGIFFKDGKVVDLIVALLHSFEFFFFAPIPLLIIYSFRQYIVAIFDRDKSKEHEHVGGHEITPELAEMAFIGSLIGVSSTYVLGQLIKVIEALPPEDTTVKLMWIGAFMVFIIIEILFYKMVSKHVSH